METVVEDKTGQAQDWEQDMATEATEPTEAATGPEEVEVEHFVGQTMTAKRAALVAFEVSSEGMGV